MQPDPSIFLRGIREELLQTGNARLAEGDFVPGVTLLRGGELLSHLMLRFERLPALFDGFYPQQRALLERCADQLAVFGIGVPPDVTTQLQADTACEDKVARHDALAAAQSRCLFALSTRRDDPVVAKAMNELMLAACQLDDDIRTARNQALQEARDSGLPAVAADGVGVPDDALVTAWLREHFPQYPDIRASKVRQQKGVNTKEVFFMELHGHPDWPAQAVMRRNRAVDTVGNEVSSEFGILDYVHRHGVLAPRPLFAGAAMGEQKRPFVVLEKLDGRAQGSAELGTETARSVLLNLARNLARLHRVDVHGLPDAYRTYGKGASARQRTLAMIDRFYQLWQGDACEPSVVTESAYIWLRDNVDRVDDSLCIVHADYSLRNNLSRDGKATGILDWELAHEGHPGEDLGYVRLDVEGVMPWSEFMQAYVEAGGFNVPDELIRYFHIYGLAFIMATLFTACNGYLTGRHADMLIGGAGTIEFGIYEAMLAKALLAEYQRSGD